MAFTLPNLPYPTNALEPSIDTQTMEIHHGRHHKAYVDNLNKALEGQAALASKPIEQLLREIKQVPENIRQAVINNGGGHANHAMFWLIMGPGGGGQPSGPLGDDLTKAFSDFATFQAQLKQAALGRFGSGWAWLVLADGKLQILSTANQDSPYMNGQVPILGVDVWEHAYYLKYQNKRPDYLAAWWNVVNWAEVSRRYEAAK
jgi:superoxide dismutase, Fe-Mn family